MSLRFLGCGIGRWLKIIDAGVLELADEADSKSVGLITRAGSTPATGTTPQRLANPWYDWVCGLFFMLCVLMYCHSYIIRFAIYGLILGGTLEGHKASWGGIYAQNRIGRCNLRVEIQVRVNVWGGRNITVPQPFLNFFQADTVCIQQTCAAMPLRYNYDKPEKPRRIKGFEVFSLIFSSFSKPKNHTEISRIAGGVSLTTNE